MSKTPSLTAKELVRLLIERGFELDRQKGSHAIYKLLDGTKRVVCRCITATSLKGRFTQS